jgi:hypothetical protein
MTKTGLFTLIARRARMPLLAIALVAAAAGIIGTAQEAKAGYFVTRCNYYGYCWNHYIVTCNPYTGWCG